MDNNGDTGNEFPRGNNKFAFSVVRDERWPLVPTVTVNVDEELKAEMEEHSEINWSEVARSAFEEKLDDLEVMERLTSESELTEEDVDELAELIDSNVAERLADR